MTRTAQQSPAPHGRRCPQPQLKPPTGNAALRPARVESESRPRRRPDRVVADRGYDHDTYRRELWLRGVKPRIAPHRARLRTRPRALDGGAEVRLAAHFRRLRIRWERDADLHHALLSLGCALVCRGTSHTMTHVRGSLLTDIMDSDRPPSQLQRYELVGGVVDQPTWIFEPKARIGASIAW